MSNFKDKYNLEERKKKSQLQLAQHPNKIMIIVQKHSKSKLPSLQNPRFLCQKHHKFQAVKKMLQNKVMQGFKDNPINEASRSFYVYVKKLLINGQSTMQKIYEQNRDEDGFLYFTYGEMEAF